MRLVSFTHAGRTRPGRMAEGEIVDLSRAAPDLPREMSALLAAGPAALEQAARADAHRESRIPLDRVHLGPPVPRPPKFLGVALNYAEHAAETGREPPRVPVFFNKQSTCANGPYDPVHLPRASPQLDYEGELGLVIGCRCRHVPARRAAEVIAGYVAVDDLSIRDWQRRAPTLTLGKSFDTHGPSGPGSSPPMSWGIPGASACAPG